MSALGFLAVACGGALGALCRGLCTRALKAHLATRFPWPTLIVNLLSCFAAGIAVALSLDDTLHLLVSVGFLGGFSTLATMNFEAVSLFQAKHYGTCAAYLATTYATTLGACAAGFAIASLMW